MDYYQGIVTEYLRADRGTFVNTECLIQLEPGDSPPKDRHWYCDAIAVNFRESNVYLCEVTFSATLNALAKRLRAWSSHWPEIRAVLTRDCAIPSSWGVTPWLFIPQDRQPTLDAKLAELYKAGEGAMPKPRVSHLEAVVPWRYKNWNRLKDDLMEGPEATSG